jgi:hypothetical protein
VCTWWRCVCVCGGGGGGALDYGFTRYRDSALTVWHLCFAFVQRCCVPVGWCAHAWRQVVLEGKSLGENANATFASKSKPTAKDGRPISA